MGQALQNVDKISLVVDVLTIKNGRKIGMIRPDQNGYYTMPLAVLGTVTDNRTYYEVEDFVGQLTSVNSYINRCLTDGKLYGEYGHPSLITLPDDVKLQRLMIVDEKNMSHHISKIWTGEKLESGGRILYGLVKPTGPYGAVLRESLDDPCLNTSFSLRSIAQSRQEKDIIRRRIKHLVTFDAVAAGGYNEASKRYAPSVESIDISVAGQLLPHARVAMEMLNNTELNEIFGAKTVILGSKTTTVVNPAHGLKDDKGQMRSIYTSLLGDIN